MSKDTLQQTQYKILLLGEVCQDVYVFGDTSRLSPEAPVPVLKKTRKEYKQGMAGNVYQNIKSISANSSINFLSNDIKNIKKIRFIDEKSKYQIMRYDIEKDLKAFQEKDIIEEDYDVIVISDYQKGFLKSESIKAICERFKNSKIFVDTKKKNLECFKNCVIKVNESESKEIFNLNESVELIVTLGSDGCVYNEKLYPVEKVDVYDVCGAGDVFLASLAVSWLETKCLEKSIKNANKCASLSVTKLGCYTVKRKEYENICF